MERPSRQTQAGFTLVELLVTMVILGVVTTGISSVVISTMRTDQNQRQMQDVIDDGRISLARIRQELRQARRVHESSGPDRLHFWVDRNQDALVQPEEQICYVVEPIGTARYQISRWAGAITAEDCAPGKKPEGETRTVVARTLLDDEPFVAYRPEPGSITDPPTREVSILLDLQVDALRGPDSTTVEGSIRLRNVP
jgi:prepilin-type N-terminal cleavage/methylation domain-containing protein